MAFKTKYSFFSVHSFAFMQQTLTTFYVPGVILDVKHSKMYVIVFHPQEIKIFTLDR